MNEIKNFFLYAFGKVFNILVKFFSIPLYSFYLTQEDFGKLGLLTIFISFLSYFLVWGLNVDYTLKFNKYNDNENILEVLRINIIYFILTLYLLLLLFLWFNFRIIDNILSLEISRVDYIKLLTIGLNITLFDFLLEKYKMTFKSKVFTVFQVINSSIFFMMIIFYLKYLEKGILSYINGYFYSSFVSLILLIAYEKLNKDLKLYKLNINLLKKSLEIGYPILIGFLLSYLLNYADRYILKEINGFNDVAVYTMGYKFGEAFNLLVVSTYLTTTNPIFFREYRYGKNKYKKSLNMSIDIFLLLSGIYFVSMTVGIKFIFHFLNKEYMNSIIITEIITLSYIFLGLSQLISSIILIKEKIRVTVIFTIIAGITNIILNYCWIPKYEVVGAAFATMICYILILIISFLYSQRLLNLELIYENKVKIIIINVSFVFLIKLIDIENLYTDFILKIFIFFIYILMIYLLKLEPLINKFIKSKIKNI